MSNINMNGWKITVVIPTKNEGDGLAQVVAAAKHLVDEVLIVDGHSTDNTREVGLHCGARVVMDNGRGKGDAYKVGIRQATGDVIVFIDGDGSHEPEDIPKLVEPIVNDSADFVIASRHKGGSDEWNGDLSTYLRSVGSGILTLCINYRWKANITDCLNGFRAIRRDVALKLDLTADDFDVEQQMVVQCLKKNFRVTEVASHEYERKWSKSKLPTYRKSYLFFGRLFRDLISK